MLIEVFLGKLMKLDGSNLADARAARDFSVHFINFQGRIQDFPEGRQLPKWVSKPIILQIFAENYMKMKESGLPRAPTWIQQ